MILISSSRFKGEIKVIYNLNNHINKETLLARLAILSKRLIKINSNLCNQVIKKDKLKSTSYD